jgi:hypothetical protein
MELASMLDGATFTDRPRSVCPVIAAFLRAYNDSIDDHHRSDLYACAATVVGTRADDLVMQRAERLANWALEQRDGLSLWLRWRTRRLPLLLENCAFAGNDAVGWAAAKIAVAGGTAAHREALALVEELAANGRQGRSAAGADTGRADARGPTERDRMALSAA